MEEKKNSESYCVAQQLEQEHIQLDKDQKRFLFISLHMNDAITRIIKEDFLLVAINADSVKRVALINTTMRLQEQHGMCQY